MIRAFVLPLQRQRPIPMARRTLVRAFLSCNEPDAAESVDLYKMKVLDLKNELKQRNLPVSGRKAELVQRLLQSTSSHPPLDPSKTYILRIKGVSSLAWDGTGVGICLMDASDPEATPWTTRKFLQSNRSVFEAEYSALLVGLHYAVQRGARNLMLELDHDVISNQIEGVFEVHKQSLRPLYEAVMGFRQSLGELHVKCISIEENKLARDLAAKALATARSGGTEVESVPDPMAERPRKVPHHPLITAQVTPSAPVIDPHQTYLLQFDGGSRGNPTGDAGAGMVLYDSVDEPRHEVWCGWQYLDTMSNNQSEYNALVKGIACAKSLGVRKIVVEGDSDLIVKQINGVYRVKDPNLKILWGKAKEVIQDFESFEIRHIRRANNKRADWLANFAMDEKTIGGFDQPKE